jgi:hypothetical protein
MLSPCFRLRFPKTVGSVGSMRYRITLVLLLGLALLTLAALAHASPPDETWQSGIYDDADFDDVVALITLLSGTPPDAPPAVLHHGPVAPSIVLSAESGALAPRLRRPDDARSPPSS